MLLKCGRSFSGHSALFSGSSEREGYVIQDVAGKLACNQQLMMPGWPNKNENIEKFFFSPGGGGVPIFS